MEHRKLVPDDNIHYKIAGNDVETEDSLVAVCSPLAAERCEFVRSIVPVNTIPCFLDWFLEE